MSFTSTLFVRRWRPLLVLLALVALLSVVGGQAVAQEVSVDPDLVNRAQNQGPVRVIITLAGNYTPDAALSPSASSRQQNRISSRQSRVTQAISSASTSSNVTHTYTYVPQMAAEVDAAGLQALMNSPDVVAIQEDIPEQLFMSSSLPSINGDDVHDLGYTGEGWTVAVLDTGVQNNHPWFMDGASSRVVAEACYNTNYAPFGYSSRCPGGVENYVGPGAANDDCADCGHGTHVAGTVAGRDPNGVHIGVAPDANIIGVNVFSQGPGDVSAFVTDQIQGLEYVYSLRNTYNIAAVNMSLGGGPVNGYCDTNERKPIFDTLTAAGIAVVVSSGNNGSSTGISTPACISTAVSVASTNDGTAVSTFSNVNFTLDLYAPGEAITSAYPGSTTETLQGTSMAAPHVAGAWATLKQASPGTDVTAMLNALTSTGVPINARGVVKPRIDMLAALNTLAPLSAPTITNISNIQRTSLNLTWTDPNTTEDEYRAYINGGLVGSFGANVTAGTINGLTCGTGYTVQISAKKGATELWSDPIGFTTAMCADFQTVTLKSPKNAMPASTTATLMFDTQAGTTKHFVQMSGPGGITSNTFDTSGCAGSTCTVNLGYSGTTGTYNVSIRPYSQDLAGPLYAAGTFEVTGSPNKIKLLSPRGYVLPSTMLELTWEGQEGVSVTNVNVSGPNGYVSNNAVDTSACGGGICSLTIPPAATAGTYTAWMQPVVGGSGGPWESSTFSVQAGNLLPVVLETPRDTVMAGSGNTLIQFKIQPGVAGFYVSVNAPGGGTVFNQYVEARNCSNGTDTCSLYVPTASEGTYTAWVQPTTGYVNGPWNSSQFLVVTTSLAPVDLLSPTGTVAPTNELSLIFNNQPGANLLNVTIYNNIGGIAYTGTSNIQHCSGTRCTVSVPGNFTAGNYTIWTQPMAGAVNGPWTSTGMTVGASLNTVALVAPTGTILPNNYIMLEFPTQAGTTAHAVTVSDGVNPLFDDIVNTEDCAGMNCKVRVPSLGNLGTYTATLRPYAGDTAGPSNNSNFNVANGALTPVTLVRPTGTIPVANIMSLQFISQAGTDAHVISVTDPSANVIYNTQVDTSWCSGTLCTVEFAGGAAEGNYSVWIQPVAGASYGPWAQSVFNVSGGVGQVFLTSPTGNYTPSGMIPLTFNAQAGVTRHQINVYSGPLLIFGTTADTTNCAGGTCTVMMPYRGYTGFHGVWIQPKAGTAGGPWAGSFFNVVSSPSEVAVEDEATPALTSDLVMVQSVCAGTWEIGNPLDERISGTWYAFDDVGDYTSGEFALEAEDSFELNTSPDVTGLTLDFGEGDTLYTEAAAVACED